MSSESVLQAFFGFFNWLYQVHLTPEQEHDIKELLRSGWTNADPTERELVEYVVRLQEGVASLSEPSRAAQRMTLRRHFEAELMTPTATDRSRVLAGIFHAVETLRPGVNAEPPAQATKADAWFDLPPQPTTTRLTSAPSRRADSPQQIAGSDAETDAGLDPLVIQEREMRRAQSAALRANVLKMRHDTIMGIIGKT